MDGDGWGNRITPQAVGSYWNKRVQVDVAAINWQKKAIFLGECKWGAERVDRQAARDLVERKTPLVLRELADQGEG